VATIAFGMGIDKSNVRWIVHADLPRSVEGYYQETGRAARDGEDGDTLLLFGPADIASIRWQIGKIETPEERERAEDRLAEILRYAGSGVCRRSQLLAHFGEHHPGSCGRCDVCAGEVVREDLTVAAMKVLSAVARTGERFGAHHLADILTGNATDKVMERGHQLLPTFGVGRDQEKGWWLSLIQELTAASHLLRGEGRLAGLHLSDTGRLLLRGKGTFLGSLRNGGGSYDDGGPGGARVAAPKEDSGRSEGWPGQEELFQCLTRLRRRIAQARDVPPYVVFSDKTLRAMARARPTDSAALLRCPGVGDRKLAEYGGDFLRIVRGFCETGECPE